MPPMLPPSQRGWQGGSNQPNVATTEADMRTRSTIVLVFAAVTAGGCNVDLLPTTPPASSTRATIQVTVATTGPDLDADGYGMLVDRVRGQPVGVNDTVTLIVAIGTHTVALDGIADNCTLGESNPRTVTVAADDTVAVAFVVVCSAFGHVRVTTVTTGIDPDPNGYSVRLTEAVHYWKVALDHLVPTNGSATLHRITSREYVVRLRGVAANCEVDNINARTVNVT